MNTPVPDQAQSNGNIKTTFSNEQMVDFRKKHFLPTASLYHDHPIHITRALGCTVWDSTGKSYLDAIGGIVCISVGHNHPKIIQALKKALESEAPQHTSTLYLNEQTVKTAQALLKEAPAGLDRVSFTNSGSEANELAFMAARHATGETTVINLRHGYHGGTSGTLAHCGQSQWRFRAQPVSGVTSAMEPYCYRCPFGQKPTSCNLECADHVESTIQTTTSGKIAGMVVEPVMGVGGFISPPDDYFKRVINIVHKYGGKYISDEVQTGAGRCGNQVLLTKDLQMDADMITMAKGIGNGAPIGAVLMKSDISDSMAGKVYFNTFGGDTYQTLQAELTLQIIHEEGLMKNSQTLGARFKDGLTQMMKKHSIIGDIRGRGLLLGIELVSDQKTKTHAPKECAKFMDLCKNKGLLVGKGGLMGNVIRLAPPLSITSEQVDEALSIMDQAFFELTPKHAGSCS